MVHKAIEHYTGQVPNSKTSRMPGAFEINTGYQEAMMELQRLQTNLALAWDGNLEARAGSLDPDTFAMEAKRAEKNRLSINQQLAKALDKLVEHVFAASKIENPHFYSSICWKKSISISQHYRTVKVLFYPFTLNKPSNHLKHHRIFIKIAIKPCLKFCI